jgi:queuine tRNA-ribosyltransferase
LAALEFTLEPTDSTTRARAGQLRTAHGAVRTPAFMPVGTAGAVKTLSPADLEAAGAEIILANTYHLYLRPGVEVVRELGGLHAFMGWSGSILTDSGGFQVLSLADLRRVTDEGVEFRSHLDGSRHFFTPESAIQAQDALGADIAMSFDQVVQVPCPPEEVEAAVRRTLDWARRGLAERERLRGAGRGRMALFGINQGGVDPAQRKRCFEALAELPFDGFALGGLWVGEGKEASYEMVEHDAALFPREKPRYLMGVGDPEDLLRAVALGVDLFDCVLPTRNARKGTVFTSTGRMVVKNAAYARDPRPLDPLCDCPTCLGFSRAYLRHLFASGEILAMRLASVHAVHFTLRLLRDARDAVLAGRLAEHTAAFLARYQSGEFVAPPAAAPAAASEENS